MKTYNLGVTECLREDLIRTTSSRYRTGPPDLIPLMGKGIDGYELYREKIKAGLDPIKWWIPSPRQVRLLHSLWEIGVGGMKSDNINLYRGSDDSSWGYWAWEDDMQTEERSTYQMGVVNINGKPTFHEVDRTASDDDPEEYDFCYARIRLFKVDRDKIL